MNKHSPTPWHTGHKVKRGVYDAQDRVVCLCDSMDEVPLSVDVYNAARIVECVNGYAAVRAERDLLRSVVETIAEMAGDGPAATMCRAALKQEAA